MDKLIISKISSSKVLLLGIGALITLLAVGAYIGIQNFTPSAKAGYWNSKLFSDYPTWYSSGTYKHNTYRDAIDLSVPQYQSGTTFKAGSNFVDVNGDGLTDLMYYQYNESSDANGKAHWFERYAVLMNQGDGFASGFKCLIEEIPALGTFTYYGDCAQ